MSTICVYNQGQFAEIAFLYGSAMVCISASCILGSIKGAGCYVLTVTRGLLLSLTYSKDDSHIS